MLTYWARVARFALRGDRPVTVDEVPVWALCVPFRQWSRPKRYDGRSFADAYGASFGRVGRWLLPLRWFYLQFLLFWPFVAAVRALRPGRGRKFLRAALFRPELALAHPDGTDTDAEIAWSRPDYAIGMYYAFTWDKTRAPWFFVDDKRTFLKVCTAHGFAIPPTFSAADAIARGGRYIVKDPELDLGYGVEIKDATALAGIEWKDELIVQERLVNHPDLREVFGDEAPLSTLRVLVLRDPDTQALVVQRTAIRIGRHGSVVDNTQQGGIWASVDRETGRIRPGVTRKSYGKVRDGAFVRYREHPDTRRPFVGVVIPWFEQGKAMALAAHEQLAPEAIALGWDVALAEVGPVLLEVNVWATCYDYDPADDAFTPTCRQIVDQLARLS